MNAPPSHPAAVNSPELGRSRALSARARPPTPLELRQRDFGEVLGRARSDTPTSGAARARSAAEDFVAVTFIQPVLREFRASNASAEPFAPGPGEKQFRAFMDAQLARQVSRAARFPLVDRLARDLLKQTSPAMGTVALTPPALAPDVHRL